MLILDFDFAEQGVKNGLPERYSWLAAFGLVVTLVWLYIEILRLISILARRLTAAARPSKAADPDSRSGGPSSSGAGAIDRRLTSGQAAAGPLDLEPHQHPALLDHRPPVVVPVRVLAGEPAVVVDEQLDGLRPLHDLGGALHLDPAAVERRR